ncbi:DsbA family protein [Nostoc sp. FACHB-152]|uniref:DsbA family protein n=1 Tax=unclassified Nostoc TaxID=2593658 RepID=UPI0016835665|nr:MULTISPECIES: thioredoxin domain-containing protein [unclassified Nostoc]MBD2449686.1 DsbA family protein [Nostoc sp. FACHB-152]MBD2469907.1 DsbA family protein [Nostoc sp. FACHB-145]
MNNDHQHRLLFPPSTQDRKQGLLSASVVLVMYGDYQCQESAEVYRLLKVIGRQLSTSLGEDYLCFIFRHFPQIKIHSQALRAAEAAEAAAVQGQFWQIHDILFIHQQQLADGYLVEYANDLGLDISQFLQDMCKHLHLERINQDIESGIHSGVTATPALFINGIWYGDRWNMEQLIAAIVNTEN